MIKKATQSKSKFRISAFGFNGRGECVAKACNQLRFSRKGGGIHAEMAIMQQANKKGIKSIFICRIGKGNDLLPIEPCSVCQTKADELGIKITTVCGEEG